MADSIDILLTGASGVLGGLVAGTLLTNEWCRIIAPIRKEHTREGVIGAIRAELDAGGIGNEADFERLITVPLPAIDQFQNFLPILQKFSVSEIINCAGSMDYGSPERLKQGNIDLTNSLIWLGKQLQVKRFIHLSTAFSSGFTDGVIRETLHESPGIDPTEYTRSKREAEFLVADSSLPYLILRPSIVIGNSHDGHYAGKSSGLYQFWAAAEKILCDKYRPEFYLVAPATKLNLVHQDAFRSSFLAAYKYLPDNSILHQVSHEATLPTVRQLTELWNEYCFRTSRVTYFDRLCDVPRDKLDHRMRTYLEVTSINNLIAAHSWQFETTNLDRLCANGLKFVDTTIDTVRICQDYFINHSPRLLSFLKRIDEDRSVSMTCGETR